MFSKTLFVALSLFSIAAPPVLGVPCTSVVTVTASGSSTDVAATSATASTSVSVPAAISTSRGSKGSSGSNNNNNNNNNNGSDSSLTTSARNNAATTTGSAASSSSTSSDGRGGKDNGNGRGNGDGRGNGNGNGNDNGNGNNDTDTTTAASSENNAVETTTSAVDATSTTATATSGTGNGNGNGSGNSSGSTDSEQSATTLNSAVIATGFASDGQEVPAEGQVASLTSTNNFINFCLTVNKPITNGQQIKTGSCNPAPMGVIAATTNMPSSKFQFPKNGDTIQANQAFTVKMAINNIETGNFVNAQSNYYSAPQQVNAQGNIIGHSHVVIEQLESLDQTTVTDPSKFAFFKGINGAAVNGVVTADVTDGLPAGVYRIASINAAANHQPVLVAVAQHGSLDDMAYFTVQ
ncbi:hypothetical protein ACEPAG_9628 [Sanghuangporus baumii]